MGLASASNWTYGWPRSPRPGTAIAKHTRESLREVLRSAARDHMIPLITRRPPTGTKSRGHRRGAAPVDFLASLGAGARAGPGSRPPTRCSTPAARGSSSGCGQAREFAGVAVRDPPRVRRGRRPASCAPAAPATRWRTRSIACSTGPEARAPRPHEVRGTRRWPDALHADRPSVTARGPVDRRHGRLEDIAGTMGDDGGRCAGNASYGSLPGAGSSASQARIGETGDTTWSNS